MARRAKIALSDEEREVLARWDRRPSASLALRFSTGIDPATCAGSGCCRDWGEGRRPRAWIAGRGSRAKFATRRCLCLDAAVLDGLRPGQASRHG